MRHSSLNERFEKFPYRLALSSAEISARQKIISEGPACTPIRAKFPEADIVVSDLKVGLESGLALLEWVKGREDSKKIHFIIFTGLQPVSPDLNVAIEKGAAQVVQKPFELASLIEIMSDFVRLYCP